MISSRTKFYASEGTTGLLSQDAHLFLEIKYYFFVGEYKFPRGGINFLGKKYRGVFITWETSTPGVLFSWEYLFSVTGIESIARFRKFNTQKRKNC